MNNWIIDTDRLGLRQMRPDDAPFVCSIFEDPAAGRFYPEMHRPEMGERWVRRNLERYREHGFGLWIIVLLETGETAGDCGLMWQSVEGFPEVEVGYHVHAAFRRRGIATEAAAACLHWGFENTDVQRIVSMVHPENLASHGVARRIHQGSRRFDRLDQRYHLFWTDRATWDQQGPTP